MCRKVTTALWAARRRSGVSFPTHAELRTLEGSPHEDEDKDSVLAMVPELPGGPVTSEPSPPLPLGSPWFLGWPPISEHVGPGRCL